MQGLVHFNISQKHELDRSRQFSNVKYIVVNVYDLELKLNKDRTLHVNNVATRIPYTFNDLNIIYYGSGLLMTTGFGLTATISSSNNGRSEITLCKEKYAGKVCGICGNGDGNKLNDFVDRDNNPVQLTGNSYTKYDTWGE